MKIVVSARARIDLNRQLDYLIDKGAAGGGTPPQLAACLLHPKDGGDVS